MPRLSSYDLYIFDCDGVIIDSNQLKIEAMKNALEAHFSSPNLVEQCLDYFRNNFGKSRFHHVGHFLESILSVTPEKRVTLEQEILADFSMQCRELYLSADLTCGFVSFIEQCRGKKYVASGSEQEELRDIFTLRGLDKYFDGIYGSPTPKATLVESILKSETSTNAVFIGDAISDMNAAIDNAINFVAYVPYSNVRNDLICRAKKYNFDILESWEYR